MKTIQYAVQREDKFVVSRVGSEVAWPILDFKKIGEGGDFTKPFEYNLEKVSVILVGSEWKLLVWTKFLPVVIKNQHRKFWGMPPLKGERPLRTLQELCQFHHTRKYLTLKSGTGPSLIGIRHGTWGSSVALYHWFKETENGYEFFGITDNFDEDDHEKATKMELKT